MTHAFPEWKRNEPARGGMKPIPIEHVLEALGLGAEIEQMRQDARADAELDALLASATR